MPITETCPRCGRSFRCQAGAIGQCDCTRVTLTPDDLNAIRAYAERTFGSYTCLCVNCLQELRTSLRAKDY